MTCPHCQSKVALTWLRYFAAPTGRHTCPRCGQAFKLVGSFGYICLLVLSTIFFGGIASSIVFYLTGKPGLGGIAYLLSALGFTLPLDRWHDDTRRKIIPLPPK